MARIGLIWMMVLCLIGGLTGLAKGQIELNTEQPDPYRWLEDVHGERSMEWVKAENERSAKILEADPRFESLRESALKVLESPTRLPAPELIDGVIYNTWQDSEHVRGILRSTNLTDYLKPDPHWETVLDYDALAQKDQQRWVHSGIQPLPNGSGIAMVGLSAGGEDAVTYREFNLRTRAFVPNGFLLPTSKQNIDWVDKDHLLVARDWGSGTMTSSGYPFVIKLWTRGTPLDTAREIFRGISGDVSAGPATLTDGQGHKVSLIVRGTSFFESEHYLLDREMKPSKVALPKKCRVDGLLDNQILVTLNEDWSPEGQSETFVQGSLVSLNLSQLRKDPIHLKPTLVIAPSETEFVQEVRVTKNHLLVTTLENVQGRAYIATFKAGIWTRKKLNVPDNLAVSVVSAEETSDHFFLGLTGFLTPSLILIGDASKGSLEKAKELAPLFDASALTVEQLEATSKDGTRVPYFVVHRKEMRYDGSNPTLLSAYGGFQVSETPRYSGVLGKLWLEKGGVFVLANIRGGGEFGPAWHEAGLKTHRQRIYDDFAAVGEDLVARKITSSRRLGIEGGSNGGLLMGVEMTQRPELWNAVIIQVPLLDMLRFEQIAAGASWVGEYGTVSNPDERRFLASISPYNQLRPDVSYPEPLIFTTTKDDRVGPVHARKFAARMEEFHKPFFYDEIVEGGHSAGADLKEQATTNATSYVYLMRKLMD